MAGRRTVSQEELEAPAKVYQFNDLKDQLDRMEKGVFELTRKMQEQNNSQVTVKYFEDRLVGMSTAFTDKLTNELGKRDSRMDGFESTVDKISKSMNRFTWATISTGLTIMGSAVAVIYFTSIKS